MGRTSLLMVMAFNIVFALVGKNLGSIASQAYKNYATYYNVAQARFITESAANLAAGQLGADSGYSPPSTTIDFWGGSYNVTKSYKTEYNNELLIFTIDARYPKTGGIIDTTILRETKVRFCEYAMYSVNENGIYWKDGEVCNGPLYTKDKLYIDGHPVFNGNVTSIGGWEGADGAASPVFNGQYKRGPVVYLPSDLGSTVADATGGKKYTVETFVDFKADGKVVVRTGSYSGPQVTGSPFASIAVFAPNGALVVDGANLHIKGIVDGRITACSNRKSGAGGTVYIDSSIVYKDAPLLAGGGINPACDDMLGIVANNDVVIDDNESNPANLTIHGSILCRTGGLVAENFDNLSDPRRIGVLTIVGGIQQQDRKGVGQFNSTTGAQLRGFSKNYSYDPRLASQSPPSYPKAQRYKILSWYDKVSWDKNFWE